MNNTIAIIGGGSWATALCKILTDNNQHVHWYMRDTQAILHIQQYGHNPNYISTATLNVNNITLSYNPQQIVDACQTLIIAIPAAYLHDTLQGINLTNKNIVSAIKGIIPSTNQIVGDYLQTQFNQPLANIAVIAGPCHAEEVAMERLSYLTIASQNAVLASNVAQALNCRYINTSINDDIYGTEYSAVLKNIMALASGICHGIGYGDNFQAVLVSTAIQEIKRFVDAVHPINRDINDHAYLGDLLVTAYSQFSRNRTFGAMIGKGYSVKAAQLELNMVAEGYFAVKCIHHINQQHNVYMPITNAVYNILYLNHNVTNEIKQLTELL
ncbi:MAG: NAD(P)H-dependent glycerol-3-phosphate dehydrogenase [Bacteroidia bacterium]|nr:NAD(P)H-dependent glycerol-3-phosphate dehydrogenase [Bacteroidia bacterium]